MSTANLFKPTTLGAFRLQHRVVLAPLTRMRADANLAPTDLVAEYYAQRSTEGGLLVSEATQVSDDGRGYPATPGIYTDAHVAGWRKVTDAVHAKGGLIVLQLFHVGRVGNSTFTTDGRPAPAPSAIAMAGKQFTAKGEFVDAETPREIGTDEVASIVEEFRRGALLAQRAGFDGVEVHAANGYLIDQFLSASTNQRNDRYGGSAANRARFLWEVLDAVQTVWPAGRIGVRLSPWNDYNDIGGTEAERLEQFTHVLQQLEARYPHLAYAHIVEQRSKSDIAAPAHDTNDGSMAKLVDASGFTGPVIAAGGFNRKSAIDATREDGGYAHAVAFGRIFIANPDLYERLRLNAELNAYDRSTFYGGAEKGYTDYPFLRAQA